MHGMYMNKSIGIGCLSLFSLLFILFLFGTVPASASADDHGNNGLNSPDEGSGYGYGSLPAGFGDPFDLAEQDGQGVSGEKPAAQQAESQKEKKSATPSVWTYGKEFFPDLWDGTKRIYSPDVGTVALIGIGVTGLSFAFDHSVDDYFQKHKPLGGGEKTGDKLGQGYVPIGLGVALFATGQLIDDKQLTDTGAVSLEALAVTGVATEALKYITQRPRPNNADKMSFPSGHAAMTSAFAASVSEMYDWNPYLAVPLFTASAFVGASRIQASEHHFSDVIAGMTLGTVVGMSMGRSRKEKNAAEASRVSVAPYVDGTYKGVVLNWRF